MGVATSILQPGVSVFDSQRAPPPQQRQGEYQHSMAALSMTPHPFSHSVQRGRVALRSRGTQFAQVEERLGCGLCLGQRLQADQGAAGWLLQLKASVQQFCRWLSLHTRVRAGRGLEAGGGGAGTRVQLLVGHAAIEDGQQGAGGVLDQLLI